MCWIKVNFHATTKRVGLCLPVVNELVDARVIGADVGFGELPHPTRGGIGWRCDHALWAGRVPVGRKAKLNSYGLKCAQWGQEKYSARGIRFTAIKGVYAIQKWKVNVMVIHNVQFIFVQCLPKKESEKKPC